MGSKGTLLFDLNEPPVEEDADGSGRFTVQPQTTAPSNTEAFGLFVTPGPQGVLTSNAFSRACSPGPQRALPSSNVKVSDLFATPAPQGILNNSAFSHASSVSGFQPFSRTKNAPHDSSSSGGKNNVCNVNVLASSSKTNKVEYVNACGQPELRPAVPQLVDKEEGEWSDAEGSVDASKSYDMTKDVKDENREVVCSAQDPDTNDGKSSGGRTSDISSVNGSEASGVGSSLNGLEASGVGPKQRESRGVDPSHTSRSINFPGKRPRIDQNKEAMLGKKRGRQTMFLNLEDVKQTGAVKSSTPKRQNFPAPVKTRAVKEGRSAFPSTECTVEKQNLPISGDAMPADASSIEGNGLVEPTESRSECNDDINYGLSSRHMKLNSSADQAAERQPPSIARQNSSKQPMDGRPYIGVQLPSRKPSLTSLNLVDPKLGGKKLPSKKQAGLSTSYQDTSVERLLREVTNENFWQHPEEAELQCVPGRFESVEEYVRVFEPLLFEECRAQLYSSWEELTETMSCHVKVHIKTLERRERGWYDVIVIPFAEHKWTFKEGDVAVLSSPNPGSVRWKRSTMLGVDEADEPGISGRVAGTVRRHMAFDKREYPGAILHFYIGDSFDPDRSDDDHILKKLQPRGTWYLTVLGSLATTQREYVALHAFRRLNIQMQNAILQPSPDHFPKYDEQTPTVPDCFTPNFVEHLHRTFNGPQLTAIQWAAMHTAAGTSSGTARRQDPWPFTLVQGPPGTGKTHTVWGMLNVIHLIQYQHYYTALLKKLAPESYKQANESNMESAASGSIDEVLQSMDQNLFRTLPKLCPKPRMLVCAPSNAATDELLSRVLGRGFIDGEMKVYRPDVARVGVDSQTRAAQAVSVERRTEQLLGKNRDEIYGWMHQLRAREAHLSQEIARLQRDLNFAAATGRAQGSVGVDPDVLMARDQNRDTLLQNLAAVVESRDKTLVEISRLFILEGRFRNANFNLEEARASLEASFANEAEIVFTTVSSSGRKLFSCLTHGFDMVVIDEAAQASEVAALPPLSLGAARCVLVGDPQQLPATVISKAAGTLLYSRSLFERFQQAGCPTMLLSVQYRMHPQIRQFPSSYFYQGRLTDSESVSSLPDEAYYKDPLLRPYIFYDISYGRESHRGGSVSFQNREEAQFCLRLYEHLQKSIKNTGVGKVSVGIITPYKLQLKCLQREFEDILKSEEGKDIYINTVDAFQGQERDVIIMSCVRASNHGVGFVADIRRMNVALTRARRALWVTGNANALVKSEDWAALIANAKERKCFMNMDSLPKDFMLSKAHQPSYPSKFSGNRGLRSGLRHKQYDAHMESRSGTPSEDDEKSNMSSVLRNGSYRASKPPLDNSVDEFGHSGDKSRDAWQHGTVKKQGSAGVLGKKE